jgi:hypothetical protein
MDRAETVAKRVLESLLPGTMEYQPEQSHGECDFELRYHGGATAAVEATASVDQKQRATIAAIHSKKKEPVIHATKCEKTWVIFPAGSANIEKIRRSADDHLSKLEQAGIEHFFWVSDYGRPGVQDICRDLRITGGSVISTEGPPTIYIANPVGGGAVGPSIAIKACEKEAWKPDNRKKLGAATSAERHLVVYIEDGLAWVALTDFEPPSVLPNLPEEITCVWLVAHRSEANDFIVWHASRNECWNGLRVVC